ncbi:hypothetical protein BOTBODRAFT_160644 [Botryobasidium botryosum FD-172 SS1]|uniref:Ribophorin II n=1 Tax=Botryobasidium botryosum (strain FD-172 SS1) TaxID=930990 RepID=A0A067MND0_BOTB1|nr:hypothetical protein BOTBODRAFT_160644 [Botryobasidium botryosum FD-172 SS1]
MLFSKIWLPLLSLPLAVRAALSIKSAKVSINSAENTVIHSEALRSVPLPDPVRVGATDTLKISFIVVDDDTGKPVQPHQAFLRFWDGKALEEGIQPLRVDTNGKSKFELNMRRPPPSLPATTESTPLNVSLILGSFNVAPAHIQLFAAYLPASAPVVPHEEEVTFHLQLEIVHTFRPDQKHPPKLISAVFAGVALAPWAVLFYLLSYLPITVSQSLSTAPFVALIAAFEGLLLWYWADLKLGQVLAYGAALGLVTAAAGKHALGSL